MVDIWFENDTMIDVGLKKGKSTKSGIPGWFLNKIGYLFFATGRAYTRLQNASKTRSGA